MPCQSQLGYAPKPFNLTSTLAKINAYSSCSLWLLVMQFFSSCVSDALLFHLINLINVPRDYMLLHGSQDRSLPRRQDRSHPREISRDPLRQRDPVLVVNLSQQNVRAHFLPSHLPVLIHTRTYYYLDGMLWMLDHHPDLHDHLSLHACAGVLG